MDCCVTKRYGRLRQGIGHREKAVGAGMIVALNAFAFAGLGEAVGAIVSTAVHEESTDATAAQAGEDELAPGIDDLIAGLTAVDELPPAGSWREGRYKSPPLIVTSPRVGIVESTIVGVHGRVSGG